MKILLIEDEPKVGRFVQKGLAEVSYSVVWVRTGAAARDALCETAFDALILDLGLPDEDGLNLLADWRRSGFNEPVIILSARDAVHDRIKGLNLGADDYLPKPFSFEELLARVRSLMRRQSDRKLTAFEYGNIKMDLLSRTVLVDEQPVELTNREFALLEHFMQNTGRVLTRTQIAEKIWEAHFDMETNLIDVYVRRLRKKLGMFDDKESVIKTIRGVGYKLA